MSTILDEKLSIFFKDDIFGDDDEVDSFLGQYDCSKVMQYLFEKLNLIAASRDNIEPAWRLGRVFAAISERYSADTEVYSLLNKTSNDLEKISLLNFLSGYWDGTKSNLNTVINLSNSVMNLVLDKSGCNEELISYGVDAVTTGYFSYSQRSQIDVDVESDLKENLRLFKVYLSTISVHSLCAKQTLNFIQSVLDK